MTWRAQCIQGVSLKISPPPKKKKLEHFHCGQVLLYEISRIRWQPTSTHTHQPVQIHPDASVSLRWAETDFQLDGPELYKCTSAVRSQSDTREVQVTAVSWSAFYWFCLSHFYYDSMTTEFVWQHCPCRLIPGPLTCSSVFRQPSTVPQPSGTAELALHSQTGRPPVQHWPPFCVAVCTRPRPM